MITVFNRKELVFTYSMKEQGDVRMLLSQNKIPYKIVTRSRGGHSLRAGARAHQGSLGLNADLMYEYKIYVHKDDYEKALAIIHHKIK